MKFSLGFRIFIGFLTINLLYIFVLIVAIIGLSRISKNASVFTNTYMPLYRFAQRIEGPKYTKIEDIKNALEIEEKEEKIAAIEFHLLSFKNYSNEYIAKIKNLLASSESVFLNSNEEKSYNQLIDRIKSLEQKTEQYNKTIEKLIESIKLGIYPGPIDYFIPVENAEAILKKEQKLLMMQIEGLIRLLIKKIEDEESTIKWQLIVFTILVFVVSIIVLINLENRLKKIINFSSKLDSMILRHQFEPIKVADEDEISGLINSINNLTSEFLKIQKETEENRNQLLTLTANLRKLNAELDYLKSFNEGIINSIKIAIIVLNEKLETIRFNPAAKALLGLSDVELNKNFFQIFPQLENKDVRNSINVALFEKRMQLIEEIQVLINNGHLILDIIISPFVGENNEIKGIIMIIENRTEIIKTKRLLNQSERLATIGRMAAQLTHQIKNPLSTIGLNLEFIREDILEDRFNKDDHIKKLNLIQSEIENLVKLSDEYLRFAKISEPKIENIDINGLISGIIELYETECKNRNIEILFQPSKQQVTIKGDYNQLRQAIINIFVNAMESLVDGGKITIATSISNGIAEINISDNGRGINESIIPHIFDPFYTTKESGIGLGLSIAAQIIKESGGKIDCKNNSQGGATFLISIPI
ncbi:MAG: ATP-binding protein [Deltaproteobacteria bacterium]|nr:ATP-binding protein [Deltaproteobacteria bacterium]